MNAVTIAAVYTFAAHHNSGHGSRGYRLLCMAGRAWRRRGGIAPRLDYWERTLREHPRSDLATKYHRLVENYGEDV